MIEPSPIPPTSGHHEITPAEASAWQIMDHLDPEVHAALMARLDSNEE